MKNWKIGMRLGLGFGIVLVLLVVMTVTSLARMASMAVDLDELGNKRAQKIELASQVNSLIDQRLGALRDVILHTDEAGINASKQRIVATRAEVDEVYKKLDAVISSEEGKKLVASIKASDDAMREKVNEMLPHALKNENDIATKLLYENILPAQEKLVAQLTAFNDYQAERGKKGYEESIAHYEAARTIMLAMAAVAILIGVLAGWFITQSVVNPIRQAVNLAETVASGDLTQRIEVTSNDETGQLLKALKTMNEGLLDIVGSIRNSVETIGTASQQIAAGNIDLSQRTEEQAASLEETAASMEELTSTVKQNAANAREANELAEGSSDIAQKGGAVVGEVVTTMAGINESSKKIVDIIGVIDGIAFQTNILALNAAVEAARAGEQGRGFAVVAGEVRSLAQRSAAAAKEIKQLINDSVEKVTSGTALVDRAGTTMSEVVDSIGRVTQIMGEITHASSEQSAGIEQVNTAVTQMDEVTQQNAALVEEAAAAATSLQDQAKLLLQAVNRFKLDESRVMHAPAPVRHAPPPRPAIKAAARPAAKGAAHPAPIKPAQAAHPSRKSEDDDWQEF
ncbi:MAG: MCP four helix bundle domain-containing protein [Burkholderiales bacterium]|nr:MCP four helix bundle domain-containing protein [Burkholderiales bacterium]